MPEANLSFSSNAYFDFAGERPEKALAEIFGFVQLPELRENLRNCLLHALASSFTHFEDEEKRIQAVKFSTALLKLMEACYCIHTGTVAPVGKTKKDNKNSKKKIREDSNCGHYKLLSVHEQNNPTEVLSQFTKSYPDHYVHSLLLDLAESAIECTHPLGQHAPCNWIFYYRRFRAFTLVAKTVGKKGK